MALVKCSECGKEVSDQAAACPNCGAPIGSKKTKPDPPPKKKRGCLFWIAAFFGFIVLLVILGSLLPEPDNTGQTQSTTKSSAPEASLNIPTDQKNFIAVLDGMRQKYRNAPNELKKTAVRVERKEQLARVLGGRFKVSGWVGQLSHMATTSDQKAYIHIKLTGSRYELKTWNNAVSDIGDDTLISHGSSLYNKIANLNEGNTVVFDGTFIPDDKDYYREGSLTEQGAMDSPEFILKFSDIRKQ